MKQIRNSVFETNSSSTHVLCLNKNMLIKKHILGLNIKTDSKYPEYIWDNYYLQLTDEFSEMDFETDWIDYQNYIQNPYQKLEYLYVYCMNKGKVWLEELYDCIQKMENKFQINIRIKEKYDTNYKFANLRQQYCDDNMFYINHESSDCLDSYIDGIIKHSKLLKPNVSDIFFDIITKPKYFICNYNGNMKDEWFVENNLQILNKEF